MSRFEGLVVWQRARALRIRIRDLSEGIRDAGLRDQMQRAAMSVMNNIAEGSERPTRADFRRFLGMARGSCGELRNQMVIACDDRWLSDADHAALTEDAVVLGKMISSLIKSLEGTS